MTCFWKGLIQGLNKPVLHYSLNRAKPKELIYVLKMKNTKTTNVLWNNQQLSNQQMSENIEHVRSLDANNINYGYLCGTCDPFLLLVCELYCINILHDYNGSKITYTHKLNKKGKILQFASDRGHFWAR